MATGLRKPSFPFLSGLIPKFIQLAKILNSRQAEANRIERTMEFCSGGLGEPLWRRTCGSLSMPVLVPLAQTNLPVSRWPSATSACAYCPWSHIFPTSYGPAIVQWIHHNPDGGRLVHQGGPLDTPAQLLSTRESKIGPASLLMACGLPKYVHVSILEEVLCTLITSFASGFHPKSNCQPEGKNWEMDDEQRALRCMVSKHHRPGPSNSCGSNRTTTCVLHLGPNKTCYKMLQ